MKHRIYGDVLQEDMLVRVDEWSRPVSEWRKELTKIEADGEGSHKSLRKKLNDGITEALLSPSYMQPEPEDSNSVPFSVFHERRMRGQKADGTAAQPKLSMFYVTFGTDHNHIIHGITFDFRHPMCIEAPDYNYARRMVFAAVGPRFSTVYAEDDFEPKYYSHFPVLPPDFNCITQPDGSCETPLPCMHDNFGLPSPQVCFTHPNTPEPGCPNCNQDANGTVSTEDDVDALVHGPTSTPTEIDYITILSELKLIVYGLPDNDPYPGLTHQACGVDSYSVSDFARDAMANDNISESSHLNTLADDLAKDITFTLELKRWFADVISGKPVHEVVTEMKEAFGY